MTEISGPRIVWEGKHPTKADVIFVHGLCGHPIKTWSASASTVSTRRDTRNILRYLKRRKEERSDAHGDGSVFWPRDLLPEDVPHARIISYGYDSDVLKMFTSGTTTNHNNLFQHARNMLGDIQRLRNETPERPVVFVCHSLGGIITKEALRLSRRADFQPNLQSLYKHTHGVIFLGAPHRGSTWAPWGALAGNLAKLAFQSPNVSLLKSLEVDSMALQMIADEFSSMIRGDIKVFSFREEKPMSGIYGLDGMIVDEFSAIIGDAAEGKEGINANHRDMCKFVSRQTDGYNKVSGEIRNFVNDVPGANQTRPSERSSSPTNKWPDFIPLQIRQKIFRDKPYNYMNFVEYDGAATITLPVLDLLTLSASVSQTAPRTLYLGNSVFELLDVLQLLPNQANHNLLRVEKIPLAQLIVDERGYYSQISQEGILRLACQHFHSLYEAQDALFVRTSIGSFQFTRAEHGNVLHFTARERSTFSIAPDNQDFHSLQQSALGRFCLQKNLNDNYFDDTVLPGSPKWVTIRPHDIVAHQNVSHNRCIRFLKPEDYEEFQREAKFAETTLSQAMEALQQQADYFDDYTKEGLGVVKIMSSKVMNAAEHLQVSVATSKWVLSDIARMPPDDAITSFQRFLIGDTSGTNFESHVEAQIPREDTADIQQDFETFTRSRYSKRNKKDKEPAAESTADAGSRAQSEEEITATAQRLIARAVSEVESLWSLYQNSMPSDSTSNSATRARVGELGVSQPRVLAALAVIQLICVTNAKIIRATSVPAPQRWLELLGSADAEILIY